GAHRARSVPGGLHARQEAFGTHTPASEALSLSTNRMHPVSAFHRALRSQRTHLYPTASVITFYNYSALHPFSCTQWIPALCKYLCKAAHSNDPPEERLYQPR